MAGAGPGTSGRPSGFACGLISACAPDVGRLRSGGPSTSRCASGWSQPLGADRAHIASYVRELTSRPLPRCDVVSIGSGVGWPIPVGSRSSVRLFSRLQVEEGCRQSDRSAEAATRPATAAEAISMA